MIHGVVDVDGMASTTWRRNTFMAGSLGSARLILADGTIYRGASFGAPGETGGELVFNTALSGYQEVLTDPSYHGQVVCMTSPLIGNYGVTSEDAESDSLHLAGFVVREASRVTSNWRAQESLREYLGRHGIVALEGVDTRAVTRRVREHGSMRCFMTTEPLSDDELRVRLDDVDELVGKDSVSVVTRREVMSWTDGRDPSFVVEEPKIENAAAARPKVVAFDFGAKHNIFRSLVDVGFDVDVVPAGTSARDVLARSPDAVFLSNGPGDPRVLEGPTRTIAELLGKIPIFGICLGHQILAQAIGAQTVKLEFGHHGINHPVLDLETGRVEITSQNHCYAVTRESLEAAGARVTHVSLNDDTIEGFALPDRQAFSVQYHPEAAPGPHDSFYLFERFRKLVVDHRRPSTETVVS